MQEVLDAVTAGASELLGDEIVGLRLIDEEEPGTVALVSAAGISPDQLEVLRRGPVGEGAGGRAIAENRLVIIDAYESDARSIPTLAAASLKTAMAAPVREAGKVVGSLVVATYNEGRRYTEEEQEVLLALAEYAGLALTDARVVDEMREAQRAKDMFLAMASHELKTPLTVIMGTLKTLQKHDQTLTPELREEMLASAHERGKELEKLIDRLLQGARAELAGVKQHVFLPDLVADACRGFDVGRVRVGDATEGFVHADVVAVQKIVGMLIENALSHSPAQSEIVVTAAILDPDASITVRNVGSLPDELDHATLFRPFHRGPDARSAGVGLGLYIAWRLALSTGGRLTAESAAGTVAFTYTFPVGTRDHLPPLRQPQDAPVDETERT